MSLKLMRPSLKPKGENKIYKCSKHKRDNANIWSIYYSLVITEMQMKI